MFQTFFSANLNKICQKKKWLKYVNKKNVLKKINFDKQNYF